MPLHAIWFLKKGDQRPSEVLPFSRVEILGSSLVEFADLLIEFVVHSFLAGAFDSVLDVIAVLPLIPGKVVELDKQTFDPFLGGLPLPESVVMALLELAPLLGQQTFQKVLPSYLSLRLSRQFDFHIKEVFTREETTAPPVEVVH
jgi:hypothetical protein